MSTTTEHKCPDCGQRLQAHEVATHHLDCPKKPERKRGRPKKDDEEEKEDFKPPESIPLDVIRQIADGTFRHGASISWKCPVCENDITIHHMDEYRLRPVKICDDCLDKLRFIVGRYQKKE